MARKVFKLVHAQARRNAIQAVQEAPEGHIVVVSEPTRTLEQNSALWPLLEEISKQVDWYGQKLTEDEWKDVFTAALKKQRAVPGIDGGFVILGASTSRMVKKDFSDLLMLAQAFADERGVVRRGAPNTPEGS